MPPSRSISRCEPLRRPASSARAAPTAPRGSVRSRRSWGCTATSSSRSPTTRPTCPRRASPVRSCARPPAPVLRRRHRGGLVPRGDARLARRFARAAASRPAADAAADRGRRRVRRVELPVRVLGARQRHGVGAGRRMPRRREGAPRAPAALAAGRPRSRGTRSTAAGAPADALVLVDGLRGGRRARGASARSRRSASPARPAAAARSSTSPARGPRRSRSTASSGR